MLRILALCLGIGLSPATASDLTEVDVELFLAVDVSRSMNLEELEIQRRGYADALASPEVFAAIEGGLIGRIAITYVEWAGQRSHNVVVPWTLIESRDQAIELVEELLVQPRTNMRRTSISGALDHARISLESNEFIGLRRVVDVSGDGPNNGGRPVLDSRAALLAEGAIINGLPLMTNDGTYSRWHLDDLDTYYRECVIGGPGSFLIPVFSWGQFADAIKRKLVLEIAAAPAPFAPEQIRPVSGYDCLIGEKIRLQRQQEWEEF
ncbi:DUF1194 domain-containing protein [Actibacterium pelagium]|uniref:DUF1194 domain-containing protein n=1 Tax=Actibacterium pelagium TaxID=2029103 RepID=A0A917EHX6_9RHOB|nr:DUF1194 domain-containing protein [Actibacterium pelagium]GGE46125.1 hypothetical protein GCM10011517_12280 [Actibacterium pelagium]